MMIVNAQGEVLAVNSQTEILFGNPIARENARGWQTEMKEL